MPGEFGGDYAEALLQLCEVPAFAAEDADSGLGLRDGVALAGDGLDEGDLPQPLGPRDGDVLAGVDGEVDVVEDDVVATGDVDVGEMEEGARRGLPACFKNNDRCVLLMLLSRRLMV